MRLWSIHPEYLDTKGLLAVWREGLLARKVLEGKTKGYKNHPQLERFKNTKDPVIYIDGYLYQILLEAKKRGYKFDESKVKNLELTDRIPVTQGQIEYEFQLLLNKLKKRNPEKYKEIVNINKIEVNPAFKLIEGEIEPWEKTFLS